MAGVVIEPDSSSASFNVRVSAEDAISFATLSGDWNPLHTSAEHAARTAYQRPVLHGAFSAGLLSRMAGMHLPGADCLLHSLRLRFVRPIVPPASLLVEGRVVAQTGGMGRVDATVSDAETGVSYVDGSYEYSRHEVAIAHNRPTPSGKVTQLRTDATVAVTGASGGLGRAVVNRLGAAALGTSRSPGSDYLHVPDISRIGEIWGERPLGGIVHCAWPTPDNQSLTGLRNVDGALEHNLATPVRDVIALAQLLRDRGTTGAPLILVGSTAADPGRHNYRMPLYTMAKSLIPTLTRILAMELANSGHRCVSVTFDVIDGGMNKRLTPAIRAMHADRAPTGQLPTLDQAADQILWVLENRGFLVSGATIALTGAAIP